MTTPTDRQSQSDASTAREAQRRIEDRDQPFWEAAYRAALQGCLAHYGDSQNDQLAASICVAHADAALQARNARWPGREDSDGGR